MKRPQMPDLSTVAGVNELIRIMNRLDDKGRALILQSLNENLTDATKMRVLAELRTHVTETDKAVRQWLIKGISASYVVGANNVIKQLRALSFKSPIPLTPMTVELLNTAPYLKPHLQAANILLSDAYLDFGKTMTGYVNGAERILNDAIKRQVRSTIAMGRLEGTSIYDIRKTVRETFADKGFTVLLDRGGRQWSLGRYSEMLARTHTNKAANEAVLNRGADFAVDIYEVSSIGATDEACGSEEGNIYSMSGNSDVYPPLAGHEPPYHPNCRHHLLLRPDLSTRRSVDSE